MSLQVVTARDIGDVTAQSDLAAVVAEALTEVSWPDGTKGIADGDVVAITSKVVSKAEGRVVPYRSAQEREHVIDSESVRLVARRGSTRIVEIASGLILAAAGVDESNTDPQTLVLLPANPDDSARRLRHSLTSRLNRKIGVLITDSLGRAWRVGIVEHAIGAAGVLTVADLRGTLDHNQRVLNRTVVATADQLAAAAGTVVTKAGRTAVTVIRGSNAVIDEDGPGAQALIRPAEEDLFRTGSID